jgi:thymidylate kinase
MHPSGVTEVVEAEVTDETFLAMQLGNKCPICGSSRTQLETLYYEYSGRSVSIATCLNCLTVYRLRPDGTIEIQLPAPNTAIWRAMWERNENRDQSHPFTEQWLAKAQELAEKRKWRLMIP